MQDFKDRFRTFRSGGGNTFKIVKTVLDYAVLGLLEAVCHILGSKLPYAQLFSILDPSISFPYTSGKAKVSSFMLYIYCAGIPMVVVIAMTLLFTKGPFIRRLFFLNAGILGLGSSVIITQLMTEAIKFIVGRPRPDTISRCQPDLVRAEANFTTTAVALFDISICTQQDKHILEDAFRSFPSGHSSMSFGGLTFLSLFLAAQLRIFVPRSVHGKHVLSYAIALVPIFVAAYVAATRISDFRHRGTDVLFGSFLGIVFAIISYRYFYPWVTSHHAGVPWAVLLDEELGNTTPNSTNVELLPTVYPKGMGTPYSDNPPSLNYQTQPFGPSTSTSAMELQPVGSNRDYSLQVPGK